MFTQRFCETCKHPKNVIRDDGSEMILRCECDFRRWSREEIKKHIHPEQWESSELDENGQPKTFLPSLPAWEPPKFKAGGEGNFKNFIEVQKARALYVLNEFCFKVVSEDLKTGEKKFALDQSFQNGSNLFIRGPSGSGRGLLMANIKLFAILRRLSTTPNPYNWSIFKNFVARAAAFGAEGIEARDWIAGHCSQVNILTLDGLRGETNQFSDERRPPARFRQAEAVDGILSDRQMRKGSMVFTSYDFIRQIGYSVGDKLPEILQSDKTMMILLFEPDEADSLLNALVNRVSSLRTLATQLEAATEKKHEDRMVQSANIDKVTEAFYIEEMFHELPVDKTESFAFQMRLPGGRYPNILRQHWTQFCLKKDKNDREFKQTCEKVLVNIVRDCRDLTAKMTDKEMLETGLMMRKACSEKEKLKGYIDKANELRHTMGKNRKKTGDGQ